MTLTCRISAPFQGRKLHWQLVLFLTLLAAFTTVPVVLIAGAEPRQPASSPPIAAFERWDARAGSSLRQVFEYWGRKDGWQVLWDSQVDVRIRSAATFSGSFEQAVLGIMKAIYPRHPQLQVTIYRGNRVLHARMPP